MILTHHIFQTAEEQSMLINYFEDIEYNANFKYY